MDKRKESKYVGLLGALAVHLLVICLLFLVSFTLPRMQEEGGMPVMLGDTPDAFGSADPSLVDVDVLPQESLMAESGAESVADEDLMVQEEEETVAVPAKKQETPKPEATTPRQPTEAERREAERKAAEAKAEEERRQVEAAARSRVSGAFGRGTQLGSQGNTQGEGLQGSPDGNSDAGAAEGVGGYGSFSLGGRSLGPGGLPRPAYNVQEEGRVVVDITVNPAGQVIATEINLQQTNTVNPTLRRAAEEAAKKARFNEVIGTTNQRGTITYLFELK